MAGPPAKQRFAVHVVMRRGTPFPSAFRVRFVACVLLSACTCWRVSEAWRDPTPLVQKDSKRAAVLSTEGSWRKLKSKKARQGTRALKAKADVSKTEAAVSEDASSIASAEANSPSASLAEFAVQETVVVARRNRTRESVAASSSASLAAAAIADADLQETTVVDERSSEGRAATAGDATIEHIESPRDDGSAVATSATTNSGPENGFEDMLTQRARGDRSAASALVEADAKASHAEQTNRRDRVDEVLRWKISGGGAAADTDEKAEEKGNDKNDKESDEAGKKKVPGKTSKDADGDAGGKGTDSDDSDEAAKPTNAKEAVSPGGKDDGEASKDVDDPEKPAKFDGIEMDAEPEGCKQHKSRGRRKIFRMFSKQNELDTVINELFDLCKSHEALRKSAKTAKEKAESMRTALEQRKIKEEAEIKELNLDLNEKIIRMRDNEKDIANKADTIQKIDAIAQKKSGIDEDEDGSKEDVDIATDKLADKNSTKVEK
eukprot:TRINITY_DN3562_c0_g1_i2.p1 TRINITY_DN3562_c0_g1~~TRINITY_DN3562_c0_g1_i2.p1  ORF type:complete len:492 (+),score=140.43 TRINITY_DN3562_c0_g1_i2:106-1581(+)